MVDDLYVGVKLTYTWAGYKRINWIREVDNQNDEIFSP